MTFRKKCLLDMDFERPKIGAEGDLLRGRDMTLIPEDKDAVAAKRLDHESNTGRIRRLCQIEPDDLRREKRMEASNFDPFLLNFTLQGGTQSGHRSSFLRHREDGFFQPNRLVATGSSPSRNAAAP